MILDLNIEYHSMMALLRCAAIGALMLAGLAVFCFIVYQSIKSK